MKQKNSKSTSSQALSEKGGHTLRVCHVADVHLGYRRFSRMTREGFNQREIDVAVAFREVVERCIALKPDITIIAGDLFHSVRPSNHMLGTAFREVRKLQRGTNAPVVIIAGNHETPRRIDSGSPLRLLAEISDVYVADAGIEVFRFPAKALAVTCVPHAALSSGLPSRLRGCDDSAFNILAVHAQVDRRLVSDFGGVDIDLSALSPFEWDYIALGHVHSRREVSLNGGYSGSIEYTSTNIWAESADPKGFLCIDLPAGKKVFHSLTSPREVHVLEAIDASGLSVDAVNDALRARISAVPGGIEGKIVRVELRNIPKEIFLRIDHRAARAWKAQALHFSIDARHPTDQTRAPQHMARGRTLKEQLMAFCQSRTGRPIASHVIAQKLQEYVTKVESDDENLQPHT